jgi:hypothetical protein
MNPYALAALFAGGIATGWVLNGWRLGEQINAIRADHAESLAAAESRARQIESGWNAGMQEVQRNAQEKIDAVAADVAAAGSAAERLRERVAELSRRPAACPGATGGGEAAGPAGGLLADVSRRLDQAADELAEFAERAAVAGEACEAAHDSIATTPAPGRGV